MVELAWAVELPLQHIMKSNSMSVVDIGDRLDHLMVLWLRRETNFGMLHFSQRNTIRPIFSLNRARPASVYRPQFNGHIHHVFRRVTCGLGPELVKRPRSEPALLVLCLGWHWSTARSRPLAMPSHVLGFIVLRLVKPLHR